MIGWTLLWALAGCIDANVVAGRSDQADFVLNELSPEARFRWRAEMEIPANTPPSAWEPELFFELRGQASGFAAVDANVVVEADAHSPFTTAPEPVTEREIRVVQVDLASVWRACEGGAPCVVTGSARVWIEGEGSLVGGVLLRGRLLGDERLAGGRISLLVEPAG